MSNCKILLVDDEYPFLEQAQIFLKKENEGFQIECVQSVKKALKKLEDEEYDVIVSDYQMPKTNGLKFLRIIRKEREMDTPFIVFTGKGREEVAINALNLGADRYLQKGGSPRSQYRVLAQAIEQEVQHYKTKENLEARKRQFKRALENAPYPAVLHAEDGEVISINDRWVELSGYEKDEIKTVYDWTERAYGEGKDLVDTDIEKLYEIDKRVDEGVYTITTKDGEKREWEFSSSPLGKLPDGRRLILSMANDITEQMKAEDKLKRSEKRYRNFFKTSKDCAFITSKDGKWIDMSDSAPEFFGYDSKEEVSNVEVPDFYKEPGVRKEHLKKIEEKGFLKEFQTDLLKKDGSVINTLITTVPIYDEDGDVKGYQGIIRDITEERERKEKLKRIQTRYDALFERSMDLIYIHDLEGNFIDANKTALDLLGYDKEEIEKLKFSDVLGEGQLEKAFETLDKILKNGAQDELTRFSLKTKDGEDIYVETKASMIYENGEPAAVLGIGRDFTDQNKIQERLKLKEKQLKELHGVASKLVIADSEEEICRLAVDAAEEILEFEVCGIDLVENRIFVPKAMSSSVGEEGYISRPVEEGGLSKNTYLEKRSYLVDDLLDNEDAKPVKNEYRSAISIPVGDFGIFQAISTSVGRYDQEDVEMAELLMSHVSEALERIRTKEREDFLHSMLRHDVGNKAQIVHGYLEIMKDYDLPEDVSDFVEKAIKATKEGSDIIEKVKKLRKIEEKEKMAEVVMSSVLDQVKSEHEDQLKEMGIEIHMEKNDCVVLAGQLLKELFSNLVENSIKHSGCDRIVFKSRSEDGECVVTVEDNGKGIPEDIKNRIFEKGYRNGDTGGSGLGLYMVKEIAENYGGRVELRNTESGGARFDVRLNRV